MAGRDLLAVILSSAVVVTLLSSSKGCGWNSTALNGILQSPNYPNNYTNDLNCVYIITAPPNYRVTVTFTDLDIEYAQGCPYDYLEFREGDSKSDQRLDGRRCGRGYVLRKRTFFNQMRIDFVSDNSVTSRGFHATYESAILEVPFYLVTGSIPGSIHRGSIWRVDLETSSNIHVPITPRPSNPTAVDYDPVDQSIYWTEEGYNNDIRTVALDGGDVQVTMSAGIGGSMMGLAVDPVARMIFYTDAGKDVIGRLTMSTLDHMTIISTNLDQPHAIALNTANRVMFWSDRGSSAKIERANYDGSDRRTLVTHALQTVNALALDVPNNRLYWADAGTDQIESSDLDGNDRRLVLGFSSAHHFFGLTTIEGSFYITDLFEVGFSENRSWVIKLENTTVNTYSTHLTSDSRLYAIRACFPTAYYNRSGQTTQTTSTQPTTQPTSPSSDTSSLNVAAIAGGVAAAVVIVCVVIAIICITKHRRERRQPGSTPQYPQLPSQGQPSGLDNPPAYSPHFSNQAYDGRLDSVYTIPDSQAGAQYSDYDTLENCAYDRDYLEPTTMGKGKK